MFIPILVRLSSYKMLQEILNSSIVEKSIRIFENNKYDSISSKNGLPKQIYVRQMETN